MSNAISNALPKSKNPYASFTMANFGGGPNLGTLPMIQKNFRTQPDAMDPAGAPTAPGNDPTAQEQQDEAAAAQRNARGRASTILTGGLGDTSTPNLASRTLLGY